MWQTHAFKAAALISLRDVRRRMIALRLIARPLARSAPTVVRTGGLVASVPRTLIASIMVSVTPASTTNAPRLAVPDVPAKKVYATSSQDGVWSV